MSSVSGVLDSVQAAAGSPLVSSLLVLSLSVIMFSLFSLIASGFGYLVLLAWASYERSRSPGASSKARLSSDKRERGSGFNERWLAMVLAIQLGALWSALAAFGSILVSGSRRIVEFVLGNLGVILGLLAIYPLVIVWDTYHELLFEAAAEIYNCFVAPLVRPLFLPVVNLYSLFFGSVLPVSNAARQIINGVTTTTAVRTLVCAGSATQALVQQLVTVAIAFSGALTVWLQQPNQGALRVAPDFYQTGVEAGVFVANLQVFADCACQPLSQVAVAPFFVPFETDDFANAFNQTLNVPVVSLSQGLAQPVIQTFINIGATPGAPFGDVFSRPSFNSTFDVTTAAALGIGNVLDQFSVSAYQVFVNAITALVSPCQSIPGWTNTSPCRSGVVDGVCSAQQQCLTATVVDIGCCRSASGLCDANTTATACEQFGRTFRSGSCTNITPPCLSGARTGCCLRGILPFGPTIADWCGDNTAQADCSVPGDFFSRDETCDQVLARNANVRCRLRTSGIRDSPPQQLGCGTCSTPGQPCQCTDCLCEYQRGALSAVSSCADGTNADTCTVDFDRLPAPPTPSIFTGIAGAIDAVILQPVRMQFHALWNIDIVFTSFDGFRYFDLQASVDAAHRAAVDLTALIEYVAVWIESIGSLAADVLDVAPSQSPVINGAPGIGALNLQAQQLDATLGTTGDLLQDALNIIADVWRVPRRFIIAVINFVFPLVQLIVNLFVGTAWLTADTAVNGAGANPLAYAQLLWGDNIALGTTYTCLAIAPSRAPINLFDVGVRNPSDTPCNAEAASLNFCRFVFQKALAQNDTSSGAENDALSEVPDYLIVSTFGGGTSTLRSSIVGCVATSNRCRAAIVLESAPAPVPRNVFEDNLNNAVAIIGAFDPFVGAICPSCANLQNFFTSLAEPLVRVVLPFFDLWVHIDKFFTTSYVKCLDLISAVEAVQDFVATFTNVYREIQFGISGEQCAAGAAARDSRIFCVLAQGFDAILDLAASVFGILWNLAQAVVDLIDGSITDPTVLTDLVSITQLEIPIRTLSFDLVALLVQVIPGSLECAQPGCCALSTNVLPSLGTFCSRNTFEKDCSGVFYAGRRCGQTVLTGGRRNNAPFSGSQTCVTFTTNNFQVPFETFNTGCCQTTVAASSLNVARICVDDSFSSECADADDLFRSESLCRAIAGPIRCPVTQNATNVVADSLGILVGDVLLLVPRVVVGVVRALAKIITQFNSTDPFTDLITAVAEPFFVLIGNGFDQVARILYCAGSRAAAEAFNEIGSAVSDILAAGLQLLTSFVLLIFYLVLGFIEVVTQGTTVILEQAGQLLVDTIFFIAFAILGEKAICDVQDTACFLCNDDLFPTCDSSIDFAINQCRRFACCNRDDVDKVGSLCIDDPGAQDDGKAIPATCRCSNFENPLTSCSTTVCANNSRKRSTVPIENPFTKLVAAELEQVKNGKRGAMSDELPTAEFCGAYLATYGFDKARNERRSGSNSTAAQCVGVATTSQRTVSGEVAVDSYIRTRVSEFVATLARLRDDARQHWQEMHREAADEAALRVAAARGNATVLELRRKQTPYGLQQLLVRERNFKPRPLHKRSNDEHAEYRAHLSALMRTHGADVSRNLAVHAMASYMHLREHWDSPFAHFTDAVATEQPQRKLSVDVQSAVATDPVAALEARRMQLGLRLAMYHAGAYMQRVSAGLGRLLGSLVQRAQGSVDAQPTGITLRYPEQSTTTTTPLAFDNSSLGLINLPPCNASEQGLCTGCLVLDDAIRVVQLSANGLAEFYPNRETGYLSYVDRFTEGIDNSLINPQGDDTFTEPNKRVPWIGERLATVRWFWQWNYTQLTTIVSGSGSSGGVPANATERLQRERASALGREDYDNFFIDQFGSVVRPLIRIADSFVSVTGDVSDEGSDVLSELFTTYVQCDYQGALQCQSPDLGVGLFDGIANTLLIYVIIGTVFVSINVIFGFSLFMLLVPFAYPITMWIAYGASPLCTGPSLILGIPGVPTCLPADIYTLVAETLQQCPVVPIALIEPSELTAAGEFLCSTCGAVPSLVNCAKFGFLNGLDVFFYSAPSIFGDAFNAQAASLLAGVAPDIAAVATLYTADYIAALGDAGLVCNRVMLPTLLTAIGIVAARIALVGSLLFSIALLSAASFWLIWTVLLWINEVIRQVDEGFVQQTRVEKLKFKQN
jgi:hypothetical protein